MTAGAINTAGYLLEVAGSGTGILSGVVSGSGGLALSGSRLELSGSNTYSGGTWVHSGRLVVDGSITASSGVTVNAGGLLGGSGLVAALGGSGSIDPGGSPGILTAPSLDPTAGLGFNFEFTQVGPPTWGNPAASGNDVLRLQNITTPFTAALSSANALNIYLDVASLEENDLFQGGFFTDRDTAFLPSVEDASFSYYLADPGGSVTYNGLSYNPYAGPLSFVWSTATATATFAGGSEAGYVTQFVAVPEPAAWSLAMAAAALAAVRRRARPLRQKAARAAFCSAE